MTDQPGWTTPGGGQQPEPPGAIPPPGAPPPPGWGPFQPSYGAVPPPAWAPPVKPGVIPLRPLGVGEILDGAIATLRAHPLVMIGLSALVAVVTQLLTLPVTWLLLRDVGDQTFDIGGSSSGGPSSGEADLTLVASTVTAGSVQVVVTLVATLVLTGILTVVVSRAVLGQPVSAAEAWAQARPRLPALFGVTLLVFAAAAAALLVGLAPGALLAVAGAPGPAVALAFLVVLPVLAVAAVYLYVAFALAPASVVLERQAVVASLRRSRALVKGAWWRTLGILVLVNVIAGIVTGVLSIPFQAGSYFAAYLAKGSGDLDPNAFVPLLIVSLGSIVGSAITWPFNAAATVLLYVDRRIRREALDLELVRAAGLAPTGQSATPGAAPQPPYGG